jgi:hypothetical protein
MPCSLAQAQSHNVCKHKTLIEGRWQDVTIDVPSTGGIMSLSAIRPSAKMLQSAANDSLMLLSDVAYLGEF